MSEQKLSILVSTYNNNSYIIDQVKSLVNQDYSNYKIIIRDDGSKTNSEHIFKNIITNREYYIVHGRNLGPAKSFFELLRLSEDAEFYSFCDQDDVWEPGKLSRAVDILSNLPLDKPAMYFGRLDIVDENLNHLTYSKVPRKGPSLGNAILENISIGATIVINKAARDLIIKRIPKDAVMHDWWLYLVVSAFGNIVYDEKPLIKYRQHGTNVVGYKVGFINSFKNRFKRLKKQKNLKNITRQVQEFYEIYGTKLDPQKKQIVSEFLYSRNTLFKRFKYALTFKVYRQSRIDNFIFRILLLLNKI